DVSRDGGADRPRYMKTLPCIVLTASVLTWKIPIRHNPKVSSKQGCARRLGRLETSKTSRKSGPCIGSTSPQSLSLLLSTPRIPHNVSATYKNGTNTAVTSRETSLVHRPRLARQSSRPSQ